MKKSGLFVALLLAASIVGSSNAFALPRLGRDAAGVVEHLDGDAKTFQLRRSKDAPPMTVTWNSRTRFIAGGEFVAAAKLREGAPVRVIYHSPFFGERFVTKVVLGAAAANRKNAQFFRRDAERGNSCGAISSHDFQSPVRAQRRG